MPHYLPLIFNLFMQEIHFTAPPPKKMLKLSTLSSLSTISNFNLSKSVFYPIFYIYYEKENLTNFQSQHAIYPRHSPLMPHYLPLAVFDLFMQKINSH